MAGYDPQNAVSFWQRMAASSQSKATGLQLFLSDHPSDAKRIERIQGWMPEAMKYYTASGASTPEPSKVSKPSTKKKKSTTRRR